MKKLNKKGFTIVELVIVIAVIAILAGVLIPTFATVVDKANKSKAMQEAKNEYEAYLAEYAEKLTGNENFTIVSGKYEFKVVNGQFQSEAKAAAASYDKVDQSKVYKVTTDTETDATGTNKKYYKLNDKGMFETTPWATGVYELDGTKDLGSTNVAIYAD